MDSSYIIHIPGLRLQESVTETPEILGGTLRALSYEDWRKLDEEAAHNVRFLYERTRPTFLVFEGVEISEHEFPTLSKNISREELLGLLVKHHKRFSTECDEATAIHNQKAQAIYIALLLTTAKEFSAPSLSMKYTVSAKRVSRHCGAVDRAMLTSGGWKHELSLLDFDAIKKVSTIILSKSSFVSLPEVQQVLHLLSSASLSDSHPIDGIVGCVRGIEGLLLKDVFTGITKSFVDRTASLLTTSPSERDALSGELERLYSLRSDAMHGRNWKQSVNSTGHDENEWYRLARVMVCSVVFSLMDRISEVSPITATDQLNTIRAELQIT